MKIHTKTESVAGRRLARKQKSTACACAIALALLAFAAQAWADNESNGLGRGPELPSPLCDSVDVPAGHKLQFRFYAAGVQIYRWTGTAWSFVAPDAALYADPCHQGQVGAHYAGPTWEASDGSQVTAGVVDRCAPYPGAISWLLLGATPQQDRGVFGHVSYIQRLNTVGGTAPAEPGTFEGEEARVPYTAEYHFYRPSKH